MSNNVAVAIMARAPRPGFAKTRLIPELGPEGAAALHARLVLHALKEIEKSQLRPATLWCAPDSAHDFFSSCAKKYPVTLLPQTQGDLGQRMASIFAQARSPLLLMGADCPCIDAQLLLRCAALLREGKPAVFLPAEDGGYGLVGLARDVSAPVMSDLFTDIPWGSDSVMAVTRNRLAAHGIEICEPAIIWDVDRPEDIDRLAARGFLLRAG